MGLVYIDNCFFFSVIWLGCCFYCILAIPKRPVVSVLSARVGLGLVVTVQGERQSSRGLPQPRAARGKPSECKCQTGRKPNTLVIIATRPSPYLSGQVRGESACCGLLAACLSHCHSPDTLASLHQQLHSGLLSVSVGCLNDAAVCFLLNNDDALTVLA